MPITERSNDKSALTALVLGSLALCADSWDSFLLVYALPEISTTFHLSLGTASLALLCTYSTRWLGGILFGALANRVGRKKALMISILWFSIFTMLSGTAPTFSYLLVIRVLFGFGMGGAYAAGGSLVIESMGDRLRGFGSGVYMSGFYAGSILAPIAYGFIGPIAGWRGLFFFGGVSLLLIPIIQILVAESPVWLATKKAGSNAARGAVSIWQLFMPGLLGVTIALIAIEFGEFFLSYPFVALLPTFLKTERHFSVADVAFAGSLVGFGSLAGALLGGWLSDIIGRKPAFLACYGLGILPTVAAMFSTDTHVIVATATVQGVVIGVLGGLVTAYENEHYPTELRAAGNGFVHNLGAFGGSVGAVIAAFLRSEIGLSLAIVIIMIAGVILGVIGICFTRETAGLSLLHAQAEGEARNQL